MCQQCLLLCHVPSVTNLPTTILYWKLPARQFWFLSAEQWVFVCLPQPHKHHGMPAECYNTLEPTMNAKKSGKSSIFALFPGGVFISGMMFFLLTVSTAVSDYQESHIQAWTLMFSFSCLLLYDCSSHLRCCSTRGPVRTAARYWQFCKKLSLLWTYIHYLRPWKPKMMVISAQPFMVLNLL